MNRVDFGKLIASLRKEHEDEDGAPWTQEKLAQETNLAAGSSLFSEDIISSIERGKRNVEAQSLLALATALQLTSNERKEFFLAASGIESQEIARHESACEEIYSQVLQSLRELCVPAAVLDSYCNVIAVNNVLLELLDFPSAYTTSNSSANKTHDYNLLKFIFSDDGSSHFRKRMGDEYTNFAFHAVSFFRTYSLAYRSTKYFRDLLIELRKSRLFKRYWNEIYFAENERKFNSAYIRSSSSKWGELSMFITARTALTTAGELHLTVFAPADPHTAKACGLAVQAVGSPIIYNLTPWPNESNLK